MGSGQRTLLAILLVASMTLAGCLSPDLQEWGADGIEVEIDRPAGAATMSTHTGDFNLENDVTNLLGCDGDGNFSITEPSIERKVRIEGWLHLSQHFPDGAESSSPAEMMSPSSVIIELGKYEQLKRPTTGKVDGVKWNTPTYGVQARPPGQDNSSVFPHMGWAIVGLIPANENILEGFGGLDWHQGIRIEGWLLDGQYMGHQEIHVSDDGMCRVYAGAQNRGFAGTMLVTSMTLSKHGVVDAENSYNAYSVPILGTWFYLIILLSSVGGAAVLFITTTGLIRRGATLSAKELMTEAQMLAARRVKREVAKESNVLKQETGKKGKIKVKQAEIIEAEKLSAEATVELDDFDIESALRGGQRPSARSVQSATSGGVIQTEEAVEIRQELEEREAARELEEAIQEGKLLATSGGPLETPKSGMMMSRETPEVTPGTHMAKPTHMSGPPTAGGDTPKVRKTRSVKKQPEPEAVPKKPEKRGPDIADDEDFSDFSL